MLQDFSSQQSENYIFTGMSPRIHRAFGAMWPEIYCNIFCMILPKRLINKCYFFFVLEQNPWGQWEPWTTPHRWNDPVTVFGTISKTGLRISKHQTISTTAHTAHTAHKHNETHVKTIHPTSPVCPTSSIHHVTIWNTPFSWGLTLFESVKHICN